MTRKRTVMLLGGALGVMAVALALAVALHDSGTAKAQSPPQTYWKVSMPDLGQHSTGWCWVAAAADSFWWYADNVSGQEGLLGGIAKPWKAIDPASTTPGSACGTVPPAGTWYDDRDGPPAPNDGSAVLGYPTVLKKIAETTFMDVNQNGTKDAGEDNYCYSEGVEKWDYLIGLRDYVNNYSTDLVVHDIIDPTKCGVGTGYIVNRTVPTMNSRDPCGPGGSGVPGVNQVVQPGGPTFTDYMTELSAGQDVLLWMEPAPGYPTPETAHVVTSVGYDNTPGVGAFALGTVTISDPWTHTTNPPLPPVASASHNDGLPPPWQGKPDHDTSGAHSALPGTDPYNQCDVKQIAPLQIQCYSEDPPVTPHVWNVVDMIFVSPREPTPYKCYQIGGPPIGESVDLETAFGIEPDVQVISPVFLCEPALKNGEGDLTQTPYKAYMIADTHDPGVVVDLETQFGIEEDVAVGPAQFLWEPALKTWQQGQPEGDLSQTPYKCYAISDPAPQVAPVNLETQFGVEQGVVVGPAQLLCEPALRDGFGDLTESPFKCYQITDQTSPGAVVDLETHFGLELGVPVGPPAFLCDPATQTITSPSVGGLAELPDVASDSGWPAGVYAALAGAIAAAVLALGGGAWYARRRLS